MTDPRLDLAVSLALDAGRRAVAALGHVVSAWKRPGERITDVDTEIQARMLREIQTWFPGDGIVAEEAGGRIDVEQEFVWVLDPLDGTNNFALGIPCFAVSVGILRTGELYAGVVHDPNTELTLQARRGAGAFSGERRLALAAHPLHGASNVCIRAPVSPALRPVVDGWLARHKVRVFGSVALHLAYAALGAIDLVVDDRAMLWDIVAGATILLESGGRLTGLHGAPLFPVDLRDLNEHAIPFAAGNPEAHREVIATLRQQQATAPPLMG